MTAGDLLHDLIALAAIAALIVAPVSMASAESLGQWSPTTNYPAQVAGPSCVTLSGQVYCVGGFDFNGNSYNDVYYATLSASGIGSWSSAPSYPTAVDSESCVNVTSGIYCVGGEDGQTVLNNVYFAAASSSGLGSWSGVAAYPVDVAATSCVAYSGYIYCVGGFDSNGNEVSSAYYASISSGVKSWSGTTKYPLAVDSESCSAEAGYIYCVAGETESGQNQNSPIANVYYAQLSSSGIGQWAAAPAYPASLAALSCATYSGYVYCVGGFDSNLLSSGSSYFWEASSSGAGSWASATPYAVPFDTGSCVTAGGYVYCVGGTSELQNGKSMLDSAYYAPISGTVTQTSTTPEFPVSAAIPITLAFALLVVAGLSRMEKKKPAA